MSRTADAPFPNDTRTGRLFVCLPETQYVAEFNVDGVLWLADCLDGQGWGEPWPGSIESFNSCGTLIDADGTEREVEWTSPRGN